MVHRVPPRLHWLVHRVIDDEDLHLAAGYRPSVKASWFGGGGTVWITHGPPGYQQPDAHDGFMGSIAFSRAPPAPGRKRIRTSSPNSAWYDARFRPRHTPASHKNLACAA